MNTNEKLLKNLGDTVHAAQELIMNVKIAPRTKPQKRISLILFNDITTKSESIFSLASDTKAAGLEVITRSVFESYIDLINLHRFPEEYPFYIMYLSSEQQRLGLQAIVSHPDSPFSTSISKGALEQLNLTVREMLDVVKSQKQAYKLMLPRKYIENNKNPSELNAKVITSALFRSTLAGKEDDYQAVYRSLSRSVHAGLTSMLGGVVVENSFTWPPVPTTPSGLPITYSAHMLQESAILIARRLRRPITKFKILREQQDKIAEDSNDD